MTAKDYLKQAYFIDRRIKAKERQLEALKAHAVYSAPQISGLPHGSVSCKSVMEESALKIMELEQYINEQIQELVRLKKEIASVIKAINNPEYETILEMRYLSFMSWDEIQYQMEYSQRYMFKIHGLALEMVRVP